MRLITPGYRWEFASYCSCFVGRCEHTITIIQYMYFVLSGCLGFAATMCWLDSRAQFLLLTSTPTAPAALDVADVNTHNCCWCFASCMGFCIFCLRAARLTPSRHRLRRILAGRRSLRRPAHLRASLLVQRGAGALPSPKASPDPARGGGPHVPPGEARCRDSRERSGQQGGWRRQSRRLGGQGADAGRTGGVEGFRGTVVKGWKRWCMLSTIGIVVGEQMNRFLSNKAKTDRFVPRSMKTAARQYGTWNRRSARSVFVSAFFMYYEVYVDTHHHHCRVALHVSGVFIQAKHLAEAQLHLEALESNLQDLINKREFDTQAYEVYYTRFCVSCLGI